jgi:hypothetical protein
MTYCSADSFSKKISGYYQLLIAIYSYSRSKKSMSQFEYQEKEFTHQKEVSQDPLKKGKHLVLSVLLWNKKRELCRAR